MMNGSNILCIYQGIDVSISIKRTKRKEIKSNGINAAKVTWK